MSGARFLLDYLRRGKVSRTPWVSLQLSVPQGRTPCSPLLRLPSRHQSRRASLSLYSDSAVSPQLLGHALRLLPPRIHLRCLRSSRVRADVGKGAEATMLVIMMLLVETLWCSPAPGKKRQEEKASFSQSNENSTHFMKVVMRSKRDKGHELFFKQKMIWIGRVS